MSSSGTRCITASAPTGHSSIPGMPFDAYTKIGEDDLKALWAYVRRIPPVKAPNPENGLSFPFNIRLGMIGWRELFFSPAYFQPTPGRNVEWNRGAYLVEALGHCSDCHSPRNVMGAIKGKAQFTGAEIDGFERRHCFRCPFESTGRRKP